MVRPLKFEIPIDTDKLQYEWYRKQLRNDLVGVWSQFLEGQGYTAMPDKSKDRKKIFRPKNPTEERFRKFDGYWFAESEYEGLDYFEVATFEEAAERLRDEIGDDIDAESLVLALVEAGVLEEHIEKFNDAEGPVTVYEGKQIRLDWQECEEREAREREEKKIKEAERLAKQEQECERIKKKTDDEARELLGLNDIEELRGKYVQILEVVRSVKNDGTTTSDNIWSEMNKLELGDHVGDVAQYICGFFEVEEGGRLFHPKPEPEPKSKPERDSGPNSEPS